MKQLKEEIIEMNNIEIKENILLVNEKQLRNIKKASYFNIFHSILGVRQLLEDQIIIDDFRTSKELDLFKNYMEGSINSVTQSISETVDDNHESELKGLEKVREELYRISSILDGYLIGLSYMGEFIDEYGIRLLGKKDYSNIPYNSKKVDELINRINQILIENKGDYNRYIYIISEIISILPMRLAKENYYGIIKNTLIRNLEAYGRSEVEIQINDYKKQFDSSSRDGYGTKFDHYFTEIQKLRKINLKDKELEELSDLVNQNINLTKEINELINLTLILGLVTNMNIVIALLDNTSIDPEIEEIHKQWTSILEDKDGKKLGKFTSIIKKKIEDVEKDILKDLEELQILNMEAVSRKDFDYDELGEEFLHTKIVLTYYNDSRFIDSKLMFPKDEESLSYEYLEQSVDSLIQYINRSTKSMDNLERRIRMRRLLSIIELPFAGINDFINYIKYSLDNRIVDKEEINFKIDHINYFIDEFLKS